MLSTDPIDWQLDDDGDLVIPIRYTSNLAGVKQAIRIRVLAVRGEWFANLDSGVRYFPNDTVAARDALLGQRFNRERALAEFRNAIASAPGVSEILELVVDFERSTRVLTVRWRTRTVWGDTLVDSLEM